MRIHPSLIVTVIGSIWGSSFYMISIALREFSPAQTGAIRIIFTGLTLLPFAIKAFGLLRQNFFPLLGVGAMGMGVPFLLYPIAQTQITSALAGMINAMVPAFTYLVSITLFRQRSHPLPWLGIAVAMGGIWLLVSPPANSGQSMFDFENIVMPLLCLACCAMYSLSINLTRFRLSHLNPEDIASLSTFILLLVYLPGLFIFDMVPSLERTDDPQWWLSLGMIVTLGVINTALVMVAFNRLIMDTSPVVASLVTYIAPIVAVTIGVLAGELVTLKQLGGLLLMLCGIFAISALGVLKTQKLRRLQVSRLQRDTTE